MWHFVIALWPTCFRATSRGSLDPFLLYVFHCTRPTVSWIAIKKRNADQTENNWTENKTAKSITCGDWSERLYSIITDIKELYQCQTTKIMWIMQSHSHRESTLQVEFTFKSIFAFFAGLEPLADDDDLKKLSLSLFFASRRLRTPSPALQLNVKKRKKIKIVAANLQIENVKLCSR